MQTPYSGRMALTGLEALKHEGAFVELVCRICISIVAGYDWVKASKKVLPRFCVNLTETKGFNVSVSLYGQQQLKG